MNPVVLFRNNGVEDEYQVCQKYFTTYQQRVDLPKDSLVICRYSALPYYKELENDIKLLGSRMINSHNEHLWIANFDYYYELNEYTPESWSFDNFYLCKDSGPFVVKGTTNSRKHSWDKCMFANNKARALEVATVLNEDSLIGTQKIIFRKYIKLKTLEVGINGLPFSNEWRFFYYKDKKLAHGFYWSNVCDCPEKAEMNAPGLEFADKIAKIASNFTNFFVLDIAQKEDGSWILIEINDGQQSGLSGCSSETLYHNLKEAWK